MRGQLDPQGRMFSYFSPESRVPADHPLRSIEDSEGARIFQQTSLKHTNG